MPLICRQASWPPIIAALGVRRPRRRGGHRNAESRMASTQACTGAPGASAMCVAAMLWPRIASSRCIGQTLADFGRLISSSGKTGPKKGPWHRVRARNSCVGVLRHQMDQLQGHRVTSGIERRRTRLQVSQINGTRDQELRGNAAMPPLSGTASIYASCAMTQAG